MSWLASYLAKPEIDGSNFTLLQLSPNYNLVSDYGIYGPAGRVFILEHDPVYNVTYLRLGAIRHGGVNSDSPVPTNEEERQLLAQVKFYDVQENELDPNILNLFIVGLDDGDGVIDVQDIIDNAHVVYLGGVDACTQGKGPDGGSTGWVANCADTLHELINPVGN